MVFYFLKCIEERFSSYLTKNLFITSTHLRATCFFLFFFSSNIVSFTRFFTSLFLIKLILLHFNSLLNFFDVLIVMDYREVVGRLVASLGNHQVHHHRWVMELELLEYHSLQLVVRRSEVIFCQTLT